MGWPRKNDGYRLYREKNGDYFISLPEPDDPDGAISCAVAGSPSSLCYVQIHRGFYVRTWPKRVEWSEVPAEWRKAFTERMTAAGDPFEPRYIRGFWRIGSVRSNQPQPVK